MTKDHLVEEDNSIVAGSFLQALPEHETLHLSHHHSLHSRVLLQ